MSNWVCPFGNSRMACASHTFSKSVCPIFQSRNNLLRQKAKFFPREDSHEGHGGHRGKLNYSHPTGSQFLSLKIFKNLCDLRDLCVS